MMLLTVSPDEVTLADMVQWERERRMKHDEDTETIENPSGRPESSGCSEKESGFNPKEPDFKGNGMGGIQEKAVVQAPPLKVTEDTV